MKSIEDIISEHNWCIDKMGYSHRTILDRVIKTRYQYPVHTSDYIWVYQNPWPLCFTMGNIGAPTKNGVRDFCFASPWSYVDRVSISGGSGNPSNVPSLYLHKDAIKDCPDKLPDDSIIQVLGVDMIRKCVTEATIIWVRQ